MNILLEVDKLHQEHLRNQNKIKMNNDGRYDFDSRNLNIMLDEVNPFHPKELTGIKAVNRVLNGTVEIKSEDKTLKTLFVEYQIDKQGNTNFVPSGISTSEAGIWRINVRRLVFEFDTNFLRFCYENKERFNFLIRESNEDRSIGRGFCLPVENILNLHNIWEDHDAGEDLEYCIARYTNPEEYRKMFMLKK